MNIDHAKQISFVSTIESSQAGRRFWSEADSAWASRMAAQEVGSAAPAERFLEVRARIAWLAITDRAPELARTMARSHQPGLLGWLVCGMALAIGILADRIGDARILNLLALPVLGLLAWHLLAYLLILLGPLRGLLGMRSRWPQRIGQWLTGLSVRPSASLPDERSALPARCLADWARLNQPLALAWGQRTLHLSAVLMALGLLASMYMRGLVTDFRVGWESTLLDTAHVHALLDAVMRVWPGPGGMQAPDLATLDAMRIRPGADLPTARPWLHWMASVLVVGVVLPRLWLALWAHARGARLRRRFPIDLNHPALRALTRSYLQAPQQVLVRPYATRLDAAAALRLNQCIQEAAGPNTRLQMAEPVFLGSEDQAAALALGPDTRLVLLFDFTATPEAENHGVFVRQAWEALRAAAARSAPILLVDEAAFRQRFGQDATRLTQRTALWRQFAGQHQALLVAGSLDDAGLPALTHALQAALFDTPGAAAA